MTDSTYSIAIFPFLKTRDAVSIGKLIFRSTDDVAELPAAQSESIREVSRMLFQKDDLQIKSASYAIVPFGDFHVQSPEMTHLSNVQAAVAYLYATPHQIFGDPFLSTEHASMAVFTPGKASIFLVRPDHHVQATEDRSDLSPDEHHNVPGYAGLYNFRHYFWVARGSRIYGPMPHVTLNISQDLSWDIRSAISSERSHYRLLLQLLDKAPTASSLRIFTAVNWFNMANSASNNDEVTIINLAVAFESLLSLPETGKTERLVDAISLLLGRTPRLDVWAQQFYDARSRVVHEGRAEQLRFIAKDSIKDSKGLAHLSLISYGRQIFQLCLGTLLVGSQLAEIAGLEEKLVTNQERFEKICTILNDKRNSPRDRLSGIEPLVDAVERYRFLGDTGLTLNSMLGAAKHAAEMLLASEAFPVQSIRQALETLVAAKRTADHFAELDALCALDNVWPDNAMPSESKQASIVRKLIKIVWSYVALHYYWLKERGKPSA